MGGSAFTGLASNAVWVSKVDVNSGTETVVAFGDSTTDGYRATLDAFATYPEQLASRLRSTGSSLAVVHAGIGGIPLTRPGGSGIPRLPDSPGMYLGFL